MSDQAGEHDSSGLYDQCAAPAFRVTSSKAPEARRPLGATRGNGAPDQTGHDPRAPNS